MWPLPIDLTSVVQGRYCCVTNYPKMEWQKPTIAIVFVFVFLFFVFVFTAQLVGSLYPDQGLNLCPRQ